MELQIQSTLNIIASANDDTTIQFYALRFLIDTCNDKLKEKDIKDLPIVSTIFSAYNRFSSDEAIRMLCCSALLRYSRFDCCIIEAQEEGIVRSLLDSIVKETNESLLTMELGVIAAYSIREDTTNSDQSKEILMRVVSLDDRWMDNRSILQQLLSIYMVLSTNATLHPLLLSSHVIQSLPAIYTKHFDSHPIILGIVSILANLVQSQEGRRFAKSIKVFHLIKTAIPIYGYDEILRRNIINIVKGMCRKSCRDSILCDGGATVIISLLNCCLSSESAVEFALQTVRIICSWQYDSLTAALENNFIPTIVMSISAFPQNPIIAAHGLRALLWMLEAGGSQVAKLLLDEGLLPLCRDLLHTQHAVEVVRAVCCVVSQLCRVSCFTAPVLAALEAARVLEEVLAGLRSQAENEAAVLEYLTLLAVLASDRNGAALVLQHDFVRQVVRCGNACQVADAAMLVSGILWKLALAGGSAVVLVAGAVDTLLKLMQQFAQSVVVARNAVGCLAILCQNEPSVCDALRRRLGITLVLDLMERFASNAQFCVQALYLLQTLLQDEACYRVLLDRDACSVVLLVIKTQMHHLTVVTMGLVFLQGFLRDDDALYQLASKPDIMPFIRDVVNSNAKDDSTLAALGEGIVSTLTAFNDSL
ncbi:hypothetical protein AV274_5713 [Blastocystis sp. ATCC 50177/Nand II]|uniref:Armadillo repeat-containing protein 8 n=1 Tax=Blastocystis sp. subtype 1 (strain ATCC 50177 / NandII) TaxID=478820 RepID=A0A196S8D2_BLAHN|nr:hypothetical protein AV274_5713 [Blastocystis sp. ATCC 50177/Nand II]